jgi:transcriptional regulator with XRE-family HTH domain
MRDLELGILFWKRVDDLLKKRSIKLIDVARMTGIPISTISSAKAKKSLPLSDTGLKIASAINTSLDYLVHGTEEKEDDIDLEDSFQMIRKSKYASNIAKSLPYMTLDQLLAIEAILKTWKKNQDP